MHRINFVYQLNELIGISLRMEMEKRFEKVFGPPLNERKKLSDIESFH